MRLYYCREDFLRNKKHWIPFQPKTSCQTLFVQVVHGFLADRAWLISWKPFLLGKQTPNKFPFYFFSHSFSWYVTCAPDRQADQVAAVTDKLTDKREKILCPKITWYFWKKKERLKLKNEASVPADFVLFSVDGVCGLPAAAAAAASPGLGLLLEAGTAGPQESGGRADRQHVPRWQRRQWRRFARGFRGVLLQPGFQKSALAQVHTLSERGKLRLIVMSGWKSQFLSIYSDQAFWDLPDCSWINPS